VKWSVLREDNVPLQYSSLTTGLYLIHLGVT